ncbi:MULTISPECIES: DUF559 domain-containing protein [unclassified Actinomyces]|uniref:endonuclease domain-containing protein n=1 Tax=unclassified Actinomyces TaxID=2609248 RepID=UPI002016FC79|nr:MULTISPECIES: DUF559 domain-containing protein [unclassified Actinomyces]MCL3777767.1 DUF559 domain-containing protein [Actinomyces sp. AC-20-1]MCL3789471.1 DUF559 domain-containing protein [Actinomyces sp. 187325]MCL3791774.1 DUF559 domain-containing protein [Actinomyces sp. 186855]MCL3794864.1 DUF559 domain-containing protein [Actinomyces sp. 217892]
MRHDLIDRVRLAGGASRVRDLRLSRTERRRLDLLIAQHELLPHPHGTVSLPGTHPAVTLARVHGGFLSCTVAARAHGLEVPSWCRGADHVIVPHGRGFPPVAGEHVHVSRRVPRPPNDRPPLLPLEETLAHLLMCTRVSTLEALCPVDQALHERRVSVEQLRAALGRGRGSALGRRRLALASGRCRSPLETSVRLDLIGAGLRHRDGVPVRGVGEVDFIVEGVIVLETDGASYHSEPEQFARDRWRDRQLTRLGYRPMRFTRQEVISHRVVEDVRAVLRRIAQERHHPGVTIQAI